MGTFDGVHLGHIHIFNKLKAKAKEINGESVVLTFWPHPRFVLGKTDRDSVKMINTLDEKIKLIEKQGIDALIIINFTKDFAKLSSCDFIEKYLYEKLKIKSLIVGYDHHFGKNRDGSYEVLKSCALQYNFSIEKVPPFIVNNEIISSTLIRKAITEGNIEKANTYLAKYYFFTGKVVAGQKIGRDLGFPTANIELSENYKLIPPIGVYAVEVKIQGKIYQGMLNIGYRPTINNAKTTRSIEVHIINFNQNIYNKEIKVYFHKKIRNEIKFHSLDRLKQQLTLDKTIISNFFNLK